MAPVARECSWTNKSQKKHPNKTMKKTETMSASCGASSLLSSALAQSFFGSGNGGRSIPPQNARSIRSETRATFVASIARGRHWLHKLISDSAATTESIADREGCSVRKINMTISLAFLAPDLVKAAIGGRLPHGMGLVRLCDLPVEWFRQHQALGLGSQ